MHIKAWLKRAFKEPLFVYLLMGGGLFALYEFVAEDFEVHVDDNSLVEISETQVNSLRAGFEQVFFRAPTDEELESMVNDFIREEVLYREAIAMELDKGDLTVRRRMLQVIDFISEDMVSLVEPEDHELQALLDAHPDRYRQPDSYSFSQVFINPERHGDNTEQHALNLLAKLNKDDSKAHLLGDNSLLPRQFQQSFHWEIERQMGERFMSALHDAEQGRWSGPIHSQFGWHLVKVEGITEGGVPEVGAIRNVLVQDFQQQKTIEARDVYFNALRSQYQVRLERDGEWLDLDNHNDSETEVVL